MNNYHNRRRFETANANTATLKTQGNHQKLIKVSLNS